MSPAIGPQMTAPFRNTGRPIGAILIDSGILTPESAEHVLQLQKAAGLRFGEAAVRLGLLTEADIRFALAQQFDYAYLRAYDRDKAVSEELVAAYQPFSPEVEQLRALRSQLLWRWLNKAGERRKCLAIVGPARGEGRSYLAANLAVVFAQLGQRTLLIDADMRAPRQHRLFGLDNKAGLSSLLGGRLEVEAVVPIPAFADLAVLPAGPIPPNPLELLNRPALDQLLAATRSRYDLVLIDTPSAESGADASMIALRAGAALAVARRHQTALAAFADLAESLLAAGVNVVGSVLNAPAARPDGEAGPPAPVWH